MPLTLVTGLPGHGKTLWVLTRYKDEAASGRPVFFTRITDLALPWLPIDPEKWRDCPPNSLIVIDEAQLSFPVRGRGQPPEWIEALATHRHLGLDFVLITQHPGLIDVFVRRLCDRHFHVVRKFGTHWATVHEFANGVRDNVEKSRSGSIRHEWRYPKSSFGLYKSAEVHTVKARVPAKIYIMVIGLVLFVGAGLYGMSRLAGRAGIGPEAANAPGRAASAGGFPAGLRAGQAGRFPASLRQAVIHKSTEEYLAEQQPRVAELLHTAPVYDEVTRPTEAPFPAACVQSATRCLCYSQQATRLPVSERLCADIAAGGFFLAWRGSMSSGGQGGRVVRAVPVAGVPEAATGGPVSLGGSMPAVLAGGGAAGGGGSSPAPSGGPPARVRR
jgi:zona occludens toxin